MDWKVPQEWRDALLIPVPKKGDLSTKAFLLFVDLRKAYNSVSRDAMWLYGVAGTSIDLVRSFHVNMQADISTDDQILFSNGLRQGCVLVPMLFILFFNMVI